MSNNLTVESIHRFQINAEKINLTKDSPERESLPHIHDWCEIYVNLSGNVSFMVEKNLYAIRSGDVIITKPYEYHHCIYNDDSDHLHFWITFSAEENTNLFRFFLDRKRGTNNLIRLPEPIRASFLGYCDTLAHIAPGDTLALSACFLSLLALLAQGLENYAIDDVNTGFPQKFTRILSHINKNYSAIESIQEVADEFDVSIATVERYFKTYLHITPKHYLEDKKIARAGRLLRQNSSITDACFESGFNDYSHFIAVFKQKYGMTPLKYQKHLLENIE